MRIWNTSPETVLDSEKNENASSSTSGAPTTTPEIVAMVSSFVPDVEEDAAVSDVL